MFYANVYESSTSRPRRVNLNAITAEAAKQEAESTLTEALAVGSGCIDVYQDGWEDMGREGRMRRTADGVEWLN